MAPSRLFQRCPGLVFNRPFSDEELFLRMERGFRSFSAGNIRIQIDCPTKLSCEDSAPCTATGPNSCARSIRHSGTRTEFRVYWEFPKPENNSGRFFQTCESTLSTAERTAPTTSSTLRGDSPLWKGSASVRLAIDSVIGSRSIWQSFRSRM